MALHSKSAPNIVKNAYVTKKLKEILTKNVEKVSNILFYTP